MQIVILQFCTASFILWRSNKNESNHIYIPIIAMTANAFEEDKRNAIAVGMNGHIAKPIQVDKLLSILSEVIRQKNL